MPVQKAAVTVQQRGVRGWLKQFFYSLNMWSMSYEFRRAWEFYESETGEILRGRKERSHAE